VRYDDVLDPLPTARAEVAGPTHDYLAGLFVGVSMTVFAALIMLAVLHLS
jgi:hypothetical protein